MDRLSVGGMASAAVIILATSVFAQDITPSYPTFNEEHIYPALVCETKKAVMDIKDWSEQYARGLITVETLQSKMDTYVPICVGGIETLTLTKEISRYVGFSLDGDSLTYGVFETTDPTKFVITAIGSSEQEL